MGLQEINVAQSRQTSLSYPFYAMTVTMRLGYNPCRPRIQTFLPLQETLDKITEVLV